MKINPDDEESDYALFGKIVLLWGQVEMFLSNIVLRLLHPLFEPKIKFEMPTTFATSIKFALKRYAAISEMKPIAAEAKTLLERLEPLHV